MSFVNTDIVPALEVRKKDRIDNPVEAQLAYQVWGLFILLNKNLTNSLQIACRKSYRVRG